MSVSFQKCCCDPLKRHTKVQKKDLRHIPQTILHQHPSLGLSSHQYICSACRKEINALTKLVVLPTSAEYIDTAATPAAGDSSNTEDQEAPYSSESMESSDNSDNSASTSLSQKQKAHSSEQTGIRVEGEAQQVALSVGDAEEIGQQLKEKLQSTTSRTLAPGTPFLTPWWSLSRSPYSLPTHQLFIMDTPLIQFLHPPLKGVLSSPNPKGHRLLPVDTEEAVKDFYLSDNISCVMPDPLKSLLENLMDQNGIDTVQFQQWTTTDRATLETRVVPADEFIDTFVNFGVEAEWHFFATSHGKSAGDGAGGTLKRTATKASLQRPYEGQILTARQLYDFAVAHIKGIQFGYATLEEHVQEAELLKERLKMSKTVPAVEAINGYVTVAYDGSCWLGCVLKVDEEGCTINITFLHPCIPAKSFVYPKHEDILDMDPSDILTRVNPTTVTGWKKIEEKLEKTEDNLRRKAEELKRKEEQWNLREDRDTSIAEKEQAELKQQQPELKQQQAVLQQQQAVLQQQQVELQREQTELQREQTELQREQTELQKQHTALTQKVVVTEEILQAPAMRFMGDVGT
eukprot:Em0019g500a